MNNNEEKLIESIILYLRKNDLDTDTHIYTIDRWIERGEEYLVDSKFVITSEGGLHFMLNYGDPEEFYDLVESFGYFIEMGHSWSYGFYCDEVILEQKEDCHKTYSDKLKDKRWKEKREKVRDKANHKCQDCGSLNKLEVHHCYYKYGLEPWQYPLDSLRCLCSTCHKKRGSIEMEIRARMADLKTEHLSTISEFLYGGMSSYPPQKVAKLIKNLNVNKEELLKELNKS
ncbi:HNH endonuclease [Pedobacter helvus]|uniref:HNH endonuclease n=1 Tax=Pedobacter helvus TaxID=2563444 RepID=A0ABW9JNE3_9SPHI|nr:HNH endonuclease [Pedobacter ureilyticus]